MQKENKLTDMNEVQAATEANRIIGLLHQKLGNIEDTSDSRVFTLMNTKRGKAQEGYIQGFSIDKVLFSTTITVNFRELPRNKPFQYDNKAIISGQYKPSFVHWFLAFIQNVASQYRFPENSSNSSYAVDESPWSWYQNYDNSN